MQYELFNQSGSSLKTWKELSPQSSSQTDGPTRSERPFCSMSSENWKESVTSVRGEYSARLKSAHPTNANEFSSSQGGWATPAARDYKGSYRPESLVRKDGKSRMDALPQQAEYDPTTNWPTPTSAEGSKIPDQANYGQVGLSNHPAIVGLPDRDKLNKSGKSQESSGLWATPTASAAEKPQGPNSKQQGLQSQAKRNAEGKVSQQPLPTQVQNWPTMHMGGNNRGAYHDKTGKGQRYLVDKVVDEEAKQQNWPTPNTMDTLPPRDPKELEEANRTRGGRKNRQALSNLREAVNSDKYVKPENWPTPDTQNHRDGTKRRKDSYGSHGVSLHHKIAETENWPTPRNMTGGTCKNGAKHCDLNSKAGGKLNPSWVEQLMGLPVGWTQLPTEWIDSDCSATE